MWRNKSGIYVLYSKYRSTFRPIHLWYGSIHSEFICSASEADADFNLIWNSCKLNYAHQISFYFELKHSVLMHVFVHHQNIFRNEQDRSHSWEPFFQVKKTTDGFKAGQKPKKNMLQCKLHSVSFVVKSTTIFYVPWESKKPTKCVLKWKNWTARWQIIRKERKTQQDRARN